MSQLEIKSEQERGRGRKSEPVREKVSERKSEPVREKVRERKWFLSMRLASRFQFVLSCCQGK